MRPKVKICGLRREEDVRMCIDYGTDILGFVTEYPSPVPWNLDAQQAAELIVAARTYSKGIETCVVTGGSVEKILELARLTQPDYIQLHGKESPAEAARLSRELVNIKIIKSLSPETSGLKEAAEAYVSAGVYALLLDPRTQDRVLHSGKMDLRVWRELADSISCPMILAGGLTPEYVQEALRRTGARLIDLMTGVEASPGVKDEAKVKALFAALG
jgi:phosphoribosylanthranilate isomerase